MADRPLDAPDWATNTNHAAGSEEWSNNATKVEPSAGKIAAGFVPDEDLFAEHINWILNNHGQWINFLDSNFGALQFGDGFDSAITLDGSVAAPAWATKSGSTYTMTRDCYINGTLLVTGSSTVLKTAGYRIFSNYRVKTEDGGKIRNDGNAASGSTAGGAGNFGSIASGGAGGAGGTVGAGTQGTDLAYSALGAVTNAGSGGAGSAGSGGRGALAPNSIEIGQMPGYHLYSPHLFGLLAGAGFSTPYASNAGALAPVLAGMGGGGGGGGGGNGGGGGAGGGIMCIAAPVIELEDASDLRCAGGAGGNAAGTDAGGGGGGSGGAVMLACIQLIVGTGTVNGATCCPGGAGGTKNGTGVAGTAGTAGVVQMSRLSTGTASGAAVASSPHVERGYASITPGVGNDHEYHDVVFAQPFLAATGANGYYPEAHTTEDGIVAFCISRTTTGMRITFSAQFTGEVRWRVEE